jgi:hypothetical protein
MSRTLRTEDDFRVLELALAALSSRRLRLVLLLDFIEPLLKPPNYPALTAYLPLLSQKLRDLVLNTDFAGTPLTVLDRILATLGELALYHTDICGSALPGDVQGHISREREKIIAWIGGKRDGNQVVSPGVWVPLVETERLLRAYPPGFAVLRELHGNVRMLRNDSVQVDRLRLAGFVEEKDQDHESFPCVLPAARKMLMSLAGREIRLPLAVHCSTDGDEIIFGASIEAGLALFATNGLLRAIEHREEFSVRRDVAITGRVDESGHFLPVDRDGLRLKVEACIYSWIRILIVPKTQVRYCQDILKELGPHADTLEVVGAGTLDDIYNSRRLTQSHRVPLPVRQGRRMWKHRRLFAGFVFLALLAVILRLWYGPLDRNPAAVRFEGETMFVLNQASEIIRRIHVGSETVNRTGAPFVNFAQICDVDRDGSDEIVWLQHPDASLNQPAAVLCQGVRDSGPRWVAQLRRRVKFTLRQPLASDGFMPMTLLAGDFDRDGRSEIFAVAVHDYEPSLVLKFEAQSGRELGCYYHAGHLNSIAAVDLNEDSVEELVLVGVNNQFNKACLVVLDPRHIDGYSPMRLDESVDDALPASHVAYVLIPRTRIGQAIPTRSSWNLAGCLSVAKPDRSIRVRLDEHNDNPEFPALYYIHFNYDLSVRNVELTDAYHITERKLLQTGRIESLLSSADWKEYETTLEYWEEFRWVHNPTGIISATRR